MSSPQKTSVSKWSVEEMKPRKYTAFGREVKNSAGSQLPPVNSISLERDFYVFLFLVGTSNLIIF